MSVEALPELTEIDNDQELDPRLRSAIDKLLRLSRDQLSDECPESRREVLENLGQYGNQEDVTNILDLLENEEASSVRVAALRAIDHLDRMTTFGTAHMISEFMDHDPNQEVRDAARELLANVRNHPETNAELRDEIEEALDEE